MNIGIRSTQYNSVLLPYTHRPIIVVPVRLGLVGAALYDTAQECARPRDDLVTVPLLHI
jgi:hypothetical protein